MRMDCEGAEYELLRPDSPSTTVDELYIAI